MEELKTFKDPLTRLANEGVRIQSRKPHESLNSKSEFHQPSIVRLKIDHNKPVSMGVAKKKIGCGTAHTQPNEDV